MLKMTKITEVPLRVDIAIPPEKPIITGFLQTTALIRGKEEMKSLQERIDDGEFETDAELIEKKLLYSSVGELEDEDGKVLTGDDAIRYVTTGKFSSYLTSALVRRYFAHFSDAPAKNSRTLRKR